MRGIGACSYEEFQYAMSVGVAAPFYLSKLFTPYFNEGGSIINISSSRDRMSQPQTESYTAAKGGIAALTHALAVSLAGKVRVNSISPGWIDTSFGSYGGSDAIQQPVHRVGNPLDIANMALFPLLRQGGIHHGGKYLHRWRHDPAHDLSWRQRVGIEGMIAVISAASLCPEIPEHSGSRVFRSPFAAVYYYGLTTPCSPDTSAAYPKTPWLW